MACCFVYVRSVFTSRRKGTEKRINKSRSDGSSQTCHFGELTVLTLCEANCCYNKGSEVNRVCAACTVLEGNDTERGMTQKKRLA